MTAAGSTSTAALELGRRTSQALLPARSSMRATPWCSLDAVLRFASSDVLILDDLGKESASAWSASMIFQIVNYRYEAMRPLIVTSQYDLAGLEKRIARQGEHESARAIVSRLRQMCHEIKLSGEDRRRG